MRRKFEMEQSEKSSGVIYLACPRSHPDPRVISARHRVADHVAWELLSCGYKVFSPLSHSKYLSSALSEDGWRELDLVLLHSCSELMYIPIDGWEDSVGVKGEIAAADAWGIPITEIRLAELGVSKEYPYLISMDEGRTFKCNRCRGILSSKLVDGMWNRGDWLGKCPECSSEIHLLDVLPPV